MKHEITFSKKEKGRIYNRLALIDRLLDVLCEAKGMSNTQRKQLSSNDDPIKALGFNSYEELVDGIVPAIVRETSKQVNERADAENLLMSERNHNLKSAKNTLSQKLVKMYFEFSGHTLHDWHQVDLQEFFDKHGYDDFDAFFRGIVTEINSVMDGKPAAKISVIALPKQPIEGKAEVYDEKQLKDFMVALENIADFHGVSLRKATKELSIRDHIYKKMIEGRAHPVWYFETAVQLAKSIPDSSNPLDADGMIFKANMKSIPTHGSQREETGFGYLMNYNTTICDKMHYSAEIGPIFQAYRSLKYDTQSEVSTTLRDDYSQRINLNYLSRVERQTRRPGRTLVANMLRVYGLSDMRSMIKEARLDSVYPLDEEAGLQQSIYQIDHIPTKSQSTQR